MLKKIVRKEAFDKSGLIYGMGHAVYTLSDPRAKILKDNARKLAKGTEWDKVLDSIYVGKVDREGNIQEEG